MVFFPSWDQTHVDLSIHSVKLSVKGGFFPQVAH
jgi:hypothetical protein